MMTSSGPEPGHFTKHHTDDGWHVSIDGANGEKVYWTENYPDEDTADEAIDFVFRLAEAVVAITFSDERTVQT